MISLINTAHAITTKTSGVIPDCALSSYGASTLECGMELFYNISYIILGLVGSITLVVFIYGGLLYMTSQGESSRMKKAQTALSGGVVGLLIVFGAYGAITFAVNALKGEDVNEQIPGEFVSCTSITQTTDKDGKTINAGAPINDGQACAPGFKCKNGVCEDTTNPTTK